ncbi:hypothetical protein DSM112329_03510 [Paraconexibacter sp. AEG42_29]|uniref:Uncharacterized protein n=1 Tax=Paraconexibacter sp. AEG42_29 TaxID=2997339 RepID=A0AAU7AYZ9_9ACTN
MPLVFAGLDEGDVRLSPAQERARKVKKQYLDGDLTRVATAFNQVEAEMMQMLLLDEGVPSMLRRTQGFDVPDMLAAGPRDVMVPASGALVAREVLGTVAAAVAAAAADSDEDDAPAEETPSAPAGRAVAWLLLAAIIVPLVFFLVLVLNQ